MALEDILGNPDERKKILGEKALKFVQAEDKLVKALAKYDLYLAELNSAVDGQLKTLTDMKEEQMLRQCRDWVAERISERAYYMSVAYHMLYSKMRGDPDFILNISAEILDASAQQWYNNANKVAARIQALNDTHALDDEKIRYLIATKPK